MMGYITGSIIVGIDHAGNRNAESTIFVFIIGIANVLQRV